ncbi:MAG: transcriptional repressor [Candidatus Krumholzibacteriia bacterium]|nr:transcriptional repressor [bacterium]MCB9517159.1 transcriptional repressor [Candidatus Latescibacterota bacterium]
MQRRTRQREAILAALQRTDRPLSPREILVEAARTVPQLGIATVYRQVTRLIEAGELREVALPGEPSRYELAGKGHHHHFRCRRCERVYELDRCPGNFRTLAPAGFLVEDHDLLLTGLCPGCRSVQA